MSSSQRRIPKYRHYKPKNLGVVRLDGRDIYLGKNDSAESWEKYHRLIAEWLAGNGTCTEFSANGNSNQFDECMVNHLLLAYMKFAQTYYVRDGEPTREIDGIRDSLRPLRKLFGRTAAKDFGPLRLKAVRQHMIDVQNLCRTEINKRIGRIKRFFSWAVSEELIPAAVSHGLQTVKGLRKGRTAARESEPVKPVPDEHIDALLPYLPAQVAGMVNLQRLTGMRPGEVVIIRLSDIDTSQDVWIYEVPRHKNDWRGHERIVAIGPQGQEVLQPFLDRQEDEFLFSPREAFEWRLARREICFKKQRKTPVYPSELRARESAKKTRRNRRRRRSTGDHYDSRSYWRALDYAFKKAAAEGNELARWFPNQLRHSRATELRKKYGVEGSRVSLGHAKVESTQIYAEKDVALAIQIALETG